MSSANSSIQCSECKIVFTARKNLYAHLRKFHHSEPTTGDKEPKQPKLECTICSNLFPSKYTLQKHVRNSHSNENDHIYCKSNQKVSRLLCPQNNCTEKFSNYRSLHVHLNTKHSVEIECENVEFDSMEEFKEWKDVIQQKSASLYTLDTAPKQLSGEIQKQYFNCHRSYAYIPKGKNVRLLKSKGSHKIGKACPSRMVVTIAPRTENTNRPVKVLFWGTHCGHVSQLGHLVLDKETRAEIAGRLKEGVSFNHILDSIRDNHHNQIGSNQRLSIIERKDLHNIVRDYDLDYSTKRHTNDAVSVKLWVEEMQAVKEDSPILYYKGQGDEDLGTALKNSDFVLIIMTGFQAQQLKTFGADTICIDGTHGTNDDIQLYTLMTVDEFGNGCPVAYCFSNRCDEYIFSLYFQQIKDKIGIITARVFMSDDAPAFYDAWSSVMGDVKSRLLCTWHVDRNWRFNLSKINGDSDKKALVYKTLRVLLQIASIDEFRTSLISILEQLLDDDDTKEFGEYFKNYYAHRAESWAYCYQFGLGINTNMYLESFHKVLEYTYLEGRKIKRLDKTIHAVIKISRDSLFNRLIKLTKNTPTEKKIRINTSHKLSCGIDSNMVSVITDGKEWLVASASDISRKYHVCLVQQTCPDACLKCNICNICIHTFKCSCTDNLIRINICKHIHACSQLYFGCSSITNDSGKVKCGSNENEVHSLLDMCQSTAISSVSFNDKIVKKCELIVDLSSNIRISDESSLRIENYLDKVINILNGSESVSLKTTQDDNVRKKIEKQKRFYTNKRTD